MPETTLERYQRTHPSLIHKGKSAKDDPVCACWAQAPFDEKASHPGTFLYKLKSTHGKELWLCKKCLLEIVALQYYIKPTTVGLHASLVPRIVIEEEQPKFPNLIVTIIQANNAKSQIECQAWPPFGKRKEKKPLEPSKFGNSKP